jgi:hypothetical protein
MMKRFSYTTINKILLLVCLFSVLSCKKLLDVEPQSSVDVSQNYRDVYDANSAVIGIYGKLLTIADRYIVLNELRADLASPTANADRYLQELSNHTVSADNPWADARPFYNIILNCNDAMKNFDIMVQQSKMTRDEYRQRYADVAAVRAWLYLQLGIHFGQVPYVTDPLETTEALKDESKYPRLPFNDLLDKLIASLKDQYLDTYPTSSSITGATNTSLNTTVDGYPTNFFFINKRCILGDLYLWRGRYTDAATMYRYVTETGYRNDGGAGNISYWQYKPTFSNFNIVYTKAGDERTLVDDNNTVSGWRSIFGSSSTSGTDVNSEWIWYLPFDKNFKPTNPFIDLFSNQSGRYLITASKLAMDNWNSQTQRNGFPYDARGRLTVRTINGQPVIAKQLYYFLDNASLLPINVLQRQGRWLLYRTGTLNLRFAEAACRDNYVDVAYALTNVGVSRVFDSVWPAAVTTATSTVPSNVPTDKTNIQQTKRPAPYDLDGRNGDVPYFRAPWHRQVGTRTRANLTDLPSALVTGNDVIGMENAIIDEAGRELAYEGNRWGDLLRVALRRNDPSFIANKISDKLTADGNAGAASAAKSKLLSTNGLYLPLKF